MAWIVFIVLSGGGVVALSSLWWADHRVLSGVILIGLAVVSVFGIAKEAAWGASEARTESAGFLLASKSTWERRTAAAIPRATPGSRKYLVAALTPLPDPRA